MRIPRAALLTVALLGIGACSGGGSTTAAGNDVLPSGGESAPVTTIAPDPGDDGAARVLFAGDSLMEEIAATTSAALGDSADTRFLLSPSLIREDSERLSWQSTMDDFRPDVVVVIFSHWERLIIGAQTAADLEDPDAYAGLVALPFAEYIADQGADLIWLGAPPLRDQRITDVYEVQNAVYRSAADASPATTFVDIAPAITLGTGTYAETATAPDGSIERLRNTDGIHFCPAGAALVADVVVDSLGGLVDVAPAPQWETGPWRTEPPFDDPAECPPA